MAKKVKKVVQKKSPLSNAGEGMYSPGSLAGIDAGKSIYSPGSLGSNIGSLSQDRDAAEMAQRRNEMVQKVKAIKPKPMKAPEAPVDINEPMSAQTWANVGNDPAKYQGYVEQFQQANQKRKRAVKVKQK